MLDMTNIANATEQVRFTVEMLGRELVDEDNTKAFDSSMNKKIVRIYKLLDEIDMVTNTYINSSK